MTVSSETFKTSLSGDGSVTTFAIGNISFTDNSEIDVYIRNETASPPTEVLQTITTNYFMTDASGAQINPATHIKFDTSAGHTVPTGSPVNKVVIKRKIDLTQSTDYASGDAFPADSHEAALDRLTLLVQQMQEQLDRSWLFPETYTGLSNVKMPEPGNNAVVRWNSDGTALISDLSLATATYKVSPSADDTTADYLEEKLKPGTGLSASTVNPGGDEEYTFTIDSTVTTLTGTQVLTNKTLTSPVINTGISGTAIDNTGTLGTSTTKVPTQNAVKTYVDAQVTASDLDFQGDSGGALSIDLDSETLTVAGGTGIATTGSSNTLTVDIDSTVTTLSGTQTLTNKTLTSPKINEDVAVTATATELNILDGVTSSTAELNIMDGVTASTAELNITDGVTSSTAEINILDGVTSTTAELNILDGVTASTAEINVLDGIASVDTDISTVSGSDDTLASAKAIKTYVDDNAGGGGAGSIDTLFTLQAKSEDAAYTAIGNGYVWGNNAVGSPAGGSLSGSATLALETTALDLIQSEKVFAYDSGGSGVRNWWYHEQAIQTGYGGKNMVLQLQYFTRNCTDSNIFRFYARDASKPVFTSDGSADAGTNQILGAVAWDASLSVSGPDDRIAAAVGDRIVIVDTSNVIHYRYITACGTVSTPGALTITYSGADIAPANSTVMLIGVMTDELDYLSANNMATSANNEAKIYRKQIQFPEGCRLLQFGFHVESTDVDVELYYDDIALSANQFLQVSTQLGSESFWGYDCSGASSGSSPKSYRAVLDNITVNSISALGTLDNNTNLGWYFQSNKKCKVDLNFGFAGSGGIVGVCAVKYSASNLGTPSSTTNNSGVNSYWDGYRIASVQDTHSTAYHGTSSASFIMEAGEYIQIISESTGYQNSNKSTVTMTVTPEVSSAILLNSQDEIFTDWVEYTPTITGSTGYSDVKFYWRRNGSNMDIRGTYDMGTIAAAVGSFTLPSGYSLDVSKLESQKTVLGRGFYIDSGNFYCAENARIWVMTYYSGGASPSTAVYYAVRSGATSIWEMDNLSGILGDNNEYFAINASVPIAGWNSNFNPVLSMPLVEIGANVEEYRLNGGAADSSSFSYRPHFDSTSAYYDFILNTINNLGVVDNNATNGWNFRATQRVKVNWTGSFGSSAGAGNWALVKTSHAPWTSTTASNNAIGNSQWNGLRVASSNSSGAGEVSLISASFIMEPGDYIQVVKAYTGNETVAYVTGINMTVEKDFSNTNMAHIIKPAVMTFGREVAQNTLAGTNAATTWNPMEINIWEGETWFATKGTGTLGVGGTNVSITLEAGTYEMQAQIVSYGINGGWLKLYDQTNSVDVARSPNIYANQTYNGSHSPMINHTWTITSSTEYRLFVYSVTAKTDYGFGVPVNRTGYTEKYLTGQIRKLK
tara:strand:- start:641 stop:4846 length:4206 start_codon:yes stop_codon:yes gene_type:complete